MTAKANSFKIGLFIILCFLLLAGGLIFLGAGSMFRQKVFLETYVDDTIQGVDIGSPVKFRGVPIGRVSKIDFCFNMYGPRPAGMGRKDYVYLEMEVDMKVFSSVKKKEIGDIIEEAVDQGLRVMLQPQGITGLNFAELNYVPQPEHQPPLTIWWTPIHYYVPSAPGTITSMLDSVNRIMASINNINVGDVMKDVKTAIETFNNTLKKFGDNINELDTAKLSADLQAVLTDLRTKIDKIPVEQLSDDGKKMMTSLRSTSDQIKALTDTLQTSPLLNADAIGAIVGDLQATAGNFRVMSENLREQPSQILFSKPPKRSQFDPGTKPQPIPTPKSESKRR